MNQEFKKAVAEQNLASVRMMLCNELLLDPRAKSFNEMLQYAKDNLPNLFEAEEPSRFTIPSDKEEWDDNILSQMKRDLNMNFSVEKLALFVEMAKYLGADKATEIEKEEEERIRRKKEEEERMHHEKEAYHKQTASRKKTGTIVTGSGAIIAITSLCVEGALGTVLSIIGGVVVIGGVILLTVPEKSKR